MANLVTLREYKDFAGLTGVGEDAKLNVIIPSISQAVKSYCGSSIVDYYATNKTEYFDITDDMTYQIMVDESPIVQVVSVEERDSQAAAYVTLISENSDSSNKYDYVVDTETDMIIRTTSTGDKYFPKGRKAVKVVYKAGYASTPADLKLACFDLVKYYLKDERKQSLSIAGAQIRNPVSTTIRDNIDFPDHIKRILDYYKVYK